MTVHTRTLSDAGPTFTDSDQESFTKVLIDTLTETDALVKIVDKTLSDTLSVSEVVDVSAAYFRTVSDTLTVSEVVAPRVDYVRTTSDTLAITDVVERTIAKVLIDDLLIGEALTKAVDKELSDTLSITEEFCVFGLDDRYVENDGGYPLTLFGSFPEAEYFVHVGPLVSTDDPQCYSGVVGQGNVIRPTAGGTEMHVVTPPLPVGGPYKFFFDAIAPLGTDEPSCQALLFVVPHTFKNRVYTLRKPFSPRWRVGARSIAAEDFPQ